MKDFTWSHRKTDRYLVTGRKVDGSAFRQEFSNPYHALYINLWEGRVWLLRSGRRILVKRVTP